MTRLALSILLLFNTAFGDLEHDEIRGASCVKVREQLYLVGGEVKRDDNWEPLTNIYKRLLSSDPSTVRQQENGWSKVYVPNFEPSGSYISAAGIPDNDLIYYYSGVFSRKEDISLKSFNTTTETTDVVVRGPILLADEIKKRKITFKILLANQNLIINDVNPNEVILMGGNTNQTSKLDSFRTVSTFDIDFKTWKTSKVDFFSRDFRITAIYKGNIYVFGRGFNYRKVKNGHKILHEEIKELKIIGSYNIPNNSWSTKLTRGSVAFKKIHYSYTQDRHLLYLVGNNDGETGIVYVLNLETFVWSSFNNSGFKGHPNGCLTFYNKFLIHNFGVDNRKGSQFIDTSQWILDDQPNNQSDNSQANLTLYIGLGLLGLVALMALIGLVFYLRRRASRITPPEILDTPIMIESLPGSENCNNTDLFEFGELKTDEQFNTKEMSPKYNF